MIKEKCPLCTTKFRDVLSLEQVGLLDPMPVKNAISVHDSTMRICQACAKTESMAAYVGLTEKMIRVAVEQDRQEALRLPPGIFWGNTRWPTGGLDEYLQDCEDSGLFLDK